MNELAGQRRARARSARGRRVLVLGLAAFAIVLTAACASDDGEGSRIDPAAGHVHALGLNPRDRSLFIATHNGLYRLARDAKRPELVGERRQDTMGFTVLGPDHFLGSGHPDLREDLPPLLGLIESRDGGQSWTSVSLLGTADFHALRVQGRRIVGYDVKSGLVMVSDDQGRSWRSGRPPETLVDVVVDPAAVDVLLAAGANHLFVSHDAGRTWRRREQGTGLLAWPRRDRLYLLDGGGRVWLSRDGGARWQQRGELGSTPAALLAVDAETLYAATHEGELEHSLDGGATWRPVG